MLHLAWVLPLLGLTPFLVLFVVRGSAFGALVFLNGAVYHGAFPQSPIACWWDTGCNVLMCIAVNAMRWQTRTFVPTIVCTMVAAAAFVGLNHGQWTVGTRTSSMHYVWHLLLVQLPLALALSLEPGVLVLGCSLHVNVLVLRCGLRVP